MNTHLSRSPSALIRELRGKKFNWKTAEVQVTGEKLDLSPSGPCLRDTLRQSARFDSLSLKTNLAAHSIHRHASQHPLTPQPGHPVERAL